MLAYAANMPRAAQRTGSPKALTLILAGHALVLAGVLTAKPELVGIQPNKPTILIDIPNPPPPKPCNTRHKSRNPRLGAIPQSSELSVKNAMHDRKNRFRPITPASQPLTGRMMAFDTR